MIRTDGNHYYLSGDEVSEDRYREVHPLPPIGCGPPGGIPHKGWPITSVALAVHPRQVAEAKRDALAKGVPTEFTSDGSPVLVDRAHRKRYLKAYGFRDNDGGYGD